jgi:hypothetical protein
MEKRPKSDFIEFIIGNVFEIVTVTLMDIEGSEPMDYDVAVSGDFRLL